MTGGIMQLVAYGAQDVYITGNPQVTFFKAVYRRHTNFAMESIPQPFNDTVDYGSRVSCIVSRNGDLMYRIYLQITLAAIEKQKSISMIDGFGNLFIKDVELEIGGQRIDKQYGDWLNIWNELSQKQEKYDGFNQMIGVINNNRHFNTSRNQQILYTPLQFWFCRNPGTALPLIALQYHEVKINMTIQDKSKLFLGVLDNAPSILDCKLYIDYIFLDTDERRRFAQATHEYLIEQLQYNGGETIDSTTESIRLNFNHPVKEIVWVTQNDEAKTYNQHTNYTTHLTPIIVQPTTEIVPDIRPGSVAGKNPISTAKIILNGHDRFSQRQGSYFHYVQPYQHHTRIPYESKGINMYSFSLEPEENQPSGSVNMSRIDNAALSITVDQDIYYQTFQSSIRKIPTTATIPIPPANYGTATTSFVTGDKIILSKSLSECTGYSVLEVTGLTTSGSLFVPNSFDIHKSEGFQTSLTFANFTTSQIMTTTSGEFTAVGSFGTPTANKPTYRLTFGDPIIVSDYTKDTSISLQEAEIRIYAVNYNVLRVMSGMAGLGFAN